MMTLLILGLTLGLDSFRVALALGLTQPSRGRRLALAFAFGLCDGMATLAGFVLGAVAAEGTSAWADHLGSLVLGLYGAWMLIVDLVRGRAEEYASPHWEMFGLPVLLSLDNLVAGVGLRLLSFPAVFSAAVLGITSGLMALAGLTLADVVGRHLRLPAGAVGGAALVVVAIVHALKGA